MVARGVDVGKFWVDEFRSPDIYVTGQYSPELFLFDLKAVAQVPNFE